MSGLRRLLVRWFVEPDRCAALLQQRRPRVFRLGLCWSGHKFHSRAAVAADLNTALAPTELLCYRYLVMALPGWRQKACPLLTIGVMTPPAKASGIVTPGGNAPPKKETEFEAVPCMGQSCAWFMNIVDEKGRITDGQCAIPLACA